MHVKIRPIGNSLGVTLPASALKDYDVEAGDTIEIKITKVVRKPRDGWDCKTLWPDTEKDPFLLEELEGNEFDRDEWQW